MRKSFLFKGVSILGAVLLLATSVMPGLQAFADYSDDTWEWMYVYDEASWDEAVANGGLAKYYAAYPDEDRWCAPNAYKDYWHYGQAADKELSGGVWPDTCTHAWSGVVNAVGSTLPWIVINFKDDFNGKIKFSYEDKEDVYPWSRTGWTNSNFGIASLYAEFQEDNFSFLTGGENFNFDITKFNAVLVPFRSLTIHYVYSNGGEAAEDYTGVFLDGDDYSVVSPKIGDYTASIATVSGTITADVEVTVTYAKSEMTITATKLATAPDDLNKEDAQANQDAVTITQEGNNIIVKGKLDQLKTYNSTNPNQGEHQWVGIILTTNLESITGAKWNGSQLTQADIDEGATVGLNSKQIIYWTKVDVIKDTPAEIAITASGYEDVNLTVSFEEKTEEKSNRSSGGGGGGSSRTTKSDDTKATTGDNAKVDENNIENNNEENVNEENKDGETVATMTDAQAVAKFGQEQIDAYKWALGNGITTMKTVESARLDEPLTRAELAKMMVVYIQKVLEKDPIVTGDVTYPDVDESLGDLYGYIKLAYQYQIMGINADGTPIEFFNPYGIVTRGEYATVFSRVLFGDKFNKDGEDFYLKHLEALKAAGILTNTIPTIHEMRGWVMLMMYRSSQNTEAIEKVANTTEATEEESSDETVNEEKVSEENENTEESTANNNEEVATENAEETTEAEATEVATGDVAEATAAEASTGDVATN